MKDAGNKGDVGKAKEVDEQLRQEISERKRIEGELRESEERYRTIFEQAADSILLIDPDTGMLVDFNERAYENLGYSREEFGKLSITDFEVIESPREVESHIEQILEKGADNFETKHRTKSGEIRNIRVSSRVISIQGKKLIQSIWRDVTAEKHAEATLRESEERYRTLFQGAQEGIGIVAPSETITFVNPAFADMLGYEIDELNGMNLRELTDEECYSKFQAETKKREQGDTNRYETRVFHKYGDLLHLSLSAAPLWNANGKFEGSISVIVDITDRKRLEEELKKRAEHLEEEVRKQTNELIRNEKMVSLGLLVAGVAHEVNNPLAYIKCNTESIEIELSELKERIQGRYPYLKTLEDIEEFTQRNMKGIGRIEVITDTLKRYAKPDTEGRVPGDINQGILDTLAVLSNQFNDGITVHRELGRLPKILCSLGQLNQVFSNVIINASQSMETGDIWIRTWWDAGKIFIEIKDNGRGIPQDKLGMIFDPFFTMREEGTGLGLSISYRIVRDHSGVIEVESETGKGTTVTIIIPIRR